MALLGSEKYPALVRVRTVARTASLLPKVHEIGASIILVVAPDKPEQLSQYNLLFSPPAHKPTGKVGGNDPCPCGSGKKFKACCQRQIEDASQLGRRASMPGVPDKVTLLRSVTDRRPTERSQAQMHRAIASREFQSAAETNEFIERHRSTGTLSAFVPESAPDKAQEFVYDAWEAKTAKRRVSLAEKALLLNPDCADAYVVLAEEQVLPAEKALALYQQAVDAAERALGPEPFKAASGHFWSDMDTRPYMRARAGLARTLWMLERRGEAIEHMKDLMRLNPGDHQGLRYWLGPWLIADGRAQEAFPMLRTFAPDWRVDWIFLASLTVYSSEGATPYAMRLLAEAMAENPLVGEYLLGKKKLPKRLPEVVTPGGEDEAIACAMLQQEAWSSVQGAREWLRGALG